MVYDVWWSYASHRRKAAVSAQPRRCRLGPHCYRTDWVRQQCRRFDRCLRYPPCNVARHIELGVADVLVIEDPETGADHQLSIGRPGNAHARRPVTVIGLHQRIGIRAVAADGRRRGMGTGGASGVRPADRQSLVGIAAASLAHEVRPLRLRRLRAEYSCGSATVKSFPS